MLFDAVELKFEPVIVTGVPAGPEAGLKDVICGIWARAFCEEINAIVNAQRFKAILFRL